MLKYLLLPTLVVPAIFATTFGWFAGVQYAHGLLFVGLFIAFFASDRALWPRR